MKKEATSEQENREDDSARLNCHQPTETSSENRGLVLVSGLAPEYSSDESEYEYREFAEWYRAGEDLDQVLDSLRDYDAFDCRISLAEYSEPQQDIDHIEQIRTCVVYIPHNENFYCETTEEASEFLTEHCRERGIPTPTRIDYVINGYYMLWGFKEGLTREGLPLWEFIQEKLRRAFEAIGADARMVQDATAMIYVPGFENSDAVGFDLSSEVMTVYSNGELYTSAYDLIFALPLASEEADEYRELSGKFKMPIPQEGVSKAEPNESLSPIKRFFLQKKAITTALKVCGDGYRKYYQHKADGHPMRDKFYDWLNADGMNEKGKRPYLRIDEDSWISAAVFREGYNRFAKGMTLRKETRYAESIDCNFVVLKWEKSELGYIPTPEQGKNLVLSVCRKHGLPEPRITYTADGLEVKWYWQDTMRKEVPNSNWFNHDWDRMQEELYKKFWYLGAVDSSVIQKGQRVYRSMITMMFRVPGSVNTTKKLKTDDRVVRDIHEGEIVSSYRDIQRILGLKLFEPERVNPEEAFRHEWEVFSREHGELVQEWMREVFMIHPTTSRSWVCVGSIQGGIWKSHYTQASDLPKYLMRLAGTPEFSQLNLYVSQGEFQRYGDRQVSNLAGIRVNFVDLDYKLLKEYHPEITENPTAEEWQKLAEEHCTRFAIPSPNAIVFTGGGVHLKWIYSEAATKADLESWQYAQKLLLEQFRTLGADSAAVDAARVLRLAGTQNQKANSEIHDRKVRVISAGSQPERTITLKGLIEGLEASKPVDPEAFNAFVPERSKRSPEQPKAEVKEIRVEAGKEHQVVPDQTEVEWIKTILRGKTSKPTYLRVKIGDNSEQIIETKQLRELLRRYYGTANVRVSLSELVSANVKASPAYIPSNPIVLTECPGATFEEQKENIFRRCDEYREIGIPRPNQIVRVGSTLLVEWRYSERLPGYAQTRWQVTQELLCRHFEDWGAMESPDYQTESLLLPVAGFVYGNGETASLEYIAAKRAYTFDYLARAVLNFSQEEVREYEEQKRKEAALRKALRKLSKELATSIARSKDCQYKFRGMAYKRLKDILTLLELRKDENGEVPQGTRELCVFWMLVFAKQAGLITTEEEFNETAQKFIELCGADFQTECQVETVMTAFKKDYRATTATLIKKLQITSDEQKLMKVLVVGKDGKLRQPRAEWLAEHDQESRKPWIKLGISRATYFRWKKAGKLPCAKVYASIPLVEKKSETGISYIMTRALLHGVVELCMRCLRGSRVRQVRGDLLDRGCMSLTVLRGLRWLRVKSKLFMKRRRRSRLRRKSRSRLRRKRKRVSEG